MEVPYGYCHCRCGGKTTIPDRNNFNIGRIKGAPMKYIHGHNAGQLKGPNSPYWKGNRKLVTNGYAKNFCPDHPRCDEFGRVLEHILVAEKALGKHLPNGAQVHHVNGDCIDNRPENLVICENAAYHWLLEVRTRAFKACGNPNWRKCQCCKQYDDPQNLLFKNKTIRHKGCYPNKRKTDNEQK